MDKQKITAAQEQEAAFIRRLNLKCDELAVEFFENSDDLAAVSFQLREAIVNRVMFRANGANPGMYGAWVKGDTDGTD